MKCTARYLRTQEERFVVILPRFETHNPAFRKPQRPRKEGRNTVLQKDHAAFLGASASLTVASVCSQSTEYVRTLLPTAFATNNQKYSAARLSTRHTGVPGLGRSISQG
jgi:hypothetical protein